MLTYADLPQKNWSELLADRLGNYRAPYTVHLPVHHPLSSDFLHVDGALNVCRRRVIPGLNSLRWAEYQASKKKELLLVQFALGPAPFVPDFSKARISVSEEGIPEAGVEHFVPTGTGVHSGLLYRFDYLGCPAATDSQGLLAIRCTVRNTGPQEQAAHVWGKVCFPREEEIFEYHYISFYWDATKYRPSPLSGFSQNNILRDGSVIGKVRPGGFLCSWIESREFPQADYEKVEATCLFVAPGFRYPHVRDAIHFETILAPGETRSFEMTLLVDYDNPQKNDLALMEQENYLQSRARLADYCRKLRPEPPTELVCPTGDWEKIFRHLQLSTLQLMVELPEGLQPTQGGTSERHFVWVWEAVIMLRPMLQLGYFNLVRQSLDYIFSLQDAGTPPKGRLTSTEGSVGTTGPKWLNTTGSALALACDYYHYSRDREFLGDFLPRIRKAVNWILGEIRSTRRLDEKNQRPAFYGLMPFGHATDGDIGCIISFTDAYIFWGFEKAVRLAEELGDPAAKEWRQELEAYRQDILQAVETITRPDGFIERKLVTNDPEELFYPEFEVAFGAFNLGLCGVLDPHSQAFQRYQAYVERHLAFGPFLGRAGHEVCYIGPAEWAWHEIYLRQGEWKKAFLALRACLYFGLTADTHEMQERFNLNDPAFCAWQPNGSGNGRTLEMMIKSFWFEDGETAVALAGMPFEWLQQNRQTALKNLHTRFGIVHLQIHAINSQECECRIRLEGTGPAKIKFPGHFTVVEKPSTSTERIYTLSAGESI